MEYRFFLINERNGVQIEIDEPVKFDGFKPLFKRDPKCHGVTWEFAEQKLEFYGKSGLMIKEEYEQYGINASIKFVVEINCGGDWQEFYSGMLDFALYEDTSGAKFFVSITVAQTSVLTTLNSRFGTKVDLESLASFDGSEMTKYENLGREIKIPSKTRREVNRAEMLSDSVFYPGARNNDTWFKVPFGQVTSNDFDKFDTESMFRECGDPNRFPRESVIFENMPSNMMDRNKFLRVKFHMEFEHTFTNSNEEKELFILRQPLPLGTPTGLRGIVFNNGDLLPQALDYNEQQNFTEHDGYTRGITAYLRVRNTGNNSSITIKAGSFIEISGDSYFEPTDCRVFMVHETLSRLTEAITDSALNAKSDYFVRSDSEINQNVTDGAGSLRCFTNGLMLRQAEYENTEDPKPKFTVSFKDILDGLIAIDAIGWGVEDDKYLRIEPWEYFYTDDVVLVCDDIAEINRKFDHAMCFSQANVGYTKWEAEERDGIDGFHGKRQYRTIARTENKLEQFSKFVADSYAIEATRRRQIADKTSDWRYDNDIFIFDLDRGDNGLQVNTGAGFGATGLHDPDTVFNVELSPARNAARWYSHVMQGVKDDKLIFTGAEGYAGARTEAQKTDPVVSVNIAENTDISPDIIAQPEKRNPKTKAETVEFNYPLTFRDFKSIKANPYGLVQFNGEHGWIKQIEADLIRGMAKFTLIPKREI